MGYSSLIFITLQGTSAKDITMVLLSASTVAKQTLI